MSCYVRVLFILFVAARVLPAEVQKSTHTYKVVNKLELQLDVYRENDDIARPVVVWFHGGGLVNWHKELINLRVKKMMLDAGYVLVSVDYRLAPETKLPEIISDVEDAVRWVRREGRKRFQADTSRIALMGESAGGYLSLAMGFRLKPPPTVIVSFWGCTDWDGNWQNKPSTNPVHQIDITREEAFAQVGRAGDPPVCDSRQRNGNTNVFYQYLRQKGLWSKEVSGWDSEKEPEKATPYIPLRNVTPGYPPTLVMHGEKDTEIPVLQSKLMADELKKKGVEHKLISIPGAEHGLFGGDPETIDSAYESFREFVNSHMRWPR